MEHLDYILVSEPLNLLDLIDQSDIDPSFKSDHAMLLINLVENTHTGGPGFWRLNKSLLED